MKFATDHIVRFEDPEDSTKLLTDPERLLTAANGATSLFTVYDARVGKSSVLDATEASGQTELSVADPAAFLVGEDVEIDLDGGEVHRAAVTISDTSAGTITVNVALPSTASVGNRVRRILGDSPWTATMVEYGTPRVSDLSWGFEGVLLQSLSGMESGMDVRIEIDFKGAGGGGLDYREILCETVLEDCA